MPQMLRISSVIRMVHVLSGINVYMETDHCLHISNRDDLTSIILSIYVYITSAQYVNV